jgi:hypothetical protein
MKVGPDLGARVSVLVNTRSYARGSRTRMYGRVKLGVRMTFYRRREDGVVCSCYYALAEAVRPVP